MKLQLLCIGKTSSEYLHRGIEEYSQRISKYNSFELKLLPLLKNSSALSHDEVISREAKLILKELDKNDHVVLLDERGTEKTSMQFSKFLQTQMNAGPKRLVFVIGGAYGAADDLKSRSDTMLSLSKMTLTHDMVRLVFCEQLYRAFTILRGEKYHHE